MDSGFLGRSGVQCYSRSPGLVLAEAARDAIGEGANDGSVTYVFDKWDNDADLNIT